MLSGQASTLGRFFYPQSKSTSLTLLASSAQGENSYAHAADPLLGVAMVDRFTLRLVQQDMQQGSLFLSPESIGKVFPRRATLSTAVLVRAPPAEESVAAEGPVDLRDFFAGVDGDYYFQGKLVRVAEKETLLLKEMQRVMREKRNAVVVEDKKVEDEDYSAYSLLTADGVGEYRKADCICSVIFSGDSFDNGVEEEIEGPPPFRWGIMLLRLWLFVLVTINLITY